MTEFLHFEHSNSTISYKKNGNDIGISLLMTKRGHENHGNARRALSAFLEWCDQNNLRVFLTPVATEQGIQKSRLRKFYCSLGFMRNQYREKAYWSAATITGH